MSKHRKGGILSAIDVVSEIEKGRPVYHRHKLQNAGWAQNWQIHMVINDAKRGHFRRAIRIFKMCESVTTPDGDGSIIGIGQLDGFNRYGVKIYGCIYPRYYHDSEISKESK